jgi:hypothetical protein
MPRSLAGRSDPVRGPSENEHGATLCVSSLTNLEEIFRSLCFLYTSSSTLTHLTDAYANQVLHSMAMQARRLHLTRTRVLTARGCGPTN